MVVLHDSTLERLWGVSSLVTECDWSEIQRLGVGENKIPLLCEVLQLFVNTKSTLMIDMEGPEPAAQAYGETLNGPLDPSHIIWCGHLEGMRTIRSLSTGARIWMPWDQIAAPMETEITPLDPEFINLHYSYVTRKRVEDIHALDGSLSERTFRKDPFFGFAVPVAVDGVDPGLLDPRLTWADPAAYDRQAAKLVDMFVRNFAKYVPFIDDDVKAAAIG